MNKLVTHAKSNTNTYFKLIKEHDTHNKWWCTHGNWYINCDKEGNILKSELKFYNYSHLSNFKLTNFYTTEEYMKEFGSTNPYE